MGSRCPYCGEKEFSTGEFLSRHQQIRMWMCGSYEWYCGSLTGNVSKIAQSAECRESQEKQSTVLKERVSRLTEVLKEVCRHLHDRTKIDVELSGLEMPDHLRSAAGEIAFQTGVLIGTLCHLGIRKEEEE